MKIDNLTLSEFKSLPLVIEGESKEVRYAGNGQVVIRLKPTIYSYTHNRAGEIPGSDRLRLKAIQAFMPVLSQAGLDHTYISINDRWILSELVLQPATADNQHPFRPADLSKARLAKLPIAPPVEVVVKYIHSGTPKHRYDRFDQFITRNNHPSFPAYQLAVDMPYPEVFVRFDWRNPMVDSKAQRLADEVLPEPMANWFIDVKQAQATALRAYNALQKHLDKSGLCLWDICFFISEDGKKLFGEVSPDCLRVRGQNGTPLDKDIWRHGGSSTKVIAKWQKFVNIISERRIQ